MKVGGKLHLFLCILAIILFFTSLTSCVNEQAADGKKSARLRYQAWCKEYGNPHNITLDEFKAVYDYARRGQSGRPPKAEEE